MIWYDMINADYAFGQWDNVTCILGDIAWQLNIE